jgi:hypothetical protein
MCLNKSKTTITLLRLAPCTFTVGIVVNMYYKIGKLLIDMRRNWCMEHFAFLLFTCDCASFVT